LALVADEPTSALDAPVRVRLLHLLAGLQQRRGMALLVISHDLDLLRRFCDRVAVMYLGEIVEQFPIGQQGPGPRHPYTRALLAAVPQLTPEAAERRDDRRPDGDRTGRRPPTIGPPGAFASLAKPPPGCRFHPRCPLAQEACRRERPELAIVASDHELRCPVVSARPEDQFIDLP
jgi:oligopeptide/dipeptide ABC transporter ATP-binding protein